jgi:hypothetical protein
MIENSFFFYKFHEKNTWAWEDETFLPYALCYVPFFHCGGPALVYRPDFVEFVVDNLELEQIISRALCVPLLIIVAVVFHIH